MSTRLPFSFFPVVPAVLFGLGLGCSLPLHHDDGATLEQSDSVYSVWAAVPTKDGKALSVVLEPRVLHRESFGVMVGDGTSENGGSAAALGVTSRAAPRRLTPGRKLTMLASASALVFARDDYHGGLSALAMGPPWTPWRAVERIDRDTLATTAEVAFDPPLARPRAWDDGRTIVDAPGSPVSDVERDVDLVAFDLDAPGGAGGRQVVFHDRGFHASSCRHRAGVAMAYEPAGDTTSIAIVSASMDPATRAWSVVRTKLPRARLDADADLACDDAGRFVALSSVSRDTTERIVSVVDVTDAAPPWHVPTDERALLLRGDGGALLVRKGERVVIARPDGTIRPTSIASNDFVSAVALGSGALVDAANGTHVVSLDTGVDVLATPRRCARSAIDAAGTVARAVCLTSSDEPGPPTAARAVAVFVVDAQGAARDAGRIALVHEYSDVGVAAVAGDTAWLATDGEHERERFVEVDLLGARVVAEPPIPSCDPSTVTVSHACLP